MTVASGSETDEAQQTELLPWSVVDIDGVVADVRHRLHHLESRPKNWRAFFAESAQDPPLAEGLAAVRTLNEVSEVVWLTGRPASCREFTLAWFRRHDLPAGRLLMRRARDFRPSATVKVEALRRLAEERPVSVLVDDDLKVCRAAEAAGFPVMHATWMTASPVLQVAQEQEGRT